MPSETVENYVRQIYLERENDRREGNTAAYLSMKRLAGAMNVVPGTVTTMVKALAREGYVRYEPRHGSRLTPEGEKLALVLSRRHRLLELFLVSVLGIDWALAHDDAHRLEHAVSDQLAGAISDYLGNPRFDPHGDPIPMPNGALPEQEHRPLSSAVPDSSVRVSRILNQEPGFLRFIERAGLLPGSEAKVLDADPDAGVMTVKTALAERVNLSIDNASHIMTRVDRL